MAITDSTTQRNRSGSLRALRQLETFFHPPDSQSLQHSSGAVLVSIDVEYNSHSNDIDQVGIATLSNDFSSGSDFHNAAIETLVTSHLFLLKRHRIPRNHWTRQYLFGVAQSIRGLNLSDFLAAVLTPVDKSRIILVGHNIISDILVIKSYCGLDISTLPCIRAIIDTAYLPSLIFDLDHPMLTLRKACRLVGISAKQFHNAGNDAYYTLKLVLLLFRLHKQQQLQCDTGVAGDLRTSWENRLACLEGIGKHNVFIRRPPRKVRNLENRGHANLYDEGDSFDLEALYVCHDIPSQEPK